MNKLDVHITPNTAKSKLAVCLWLPRIFLGITLLLGGGFIIQQNDWNALIFLGAISALVYGLIRPSMPIYKMLSEYEGPIFTVTESGFVHHFRNPGHLIKWEEIEVVRLKSGGGNVHMFLVVMQGKSFATKIRELVTVHPFMYSYNDLILLTDGSEEYAVPRIKKFMQKYAPSEINKL